jgi:transposase
MWKPEHRRAADRSSLRYPSDLTEAEWALVAPMIPPARRGGRRRSVNVREVLNGIFYVLWTGCQWKALPKDLPPKSTVHDYLELWNWDGTLERIHQRTVRRRARAGGPRTEPDSSHYRLADGEGRAKRGASLDPSGYDAGKKIKGRKRHILVDTLGLLLNVVIHPADVQDRDGAFHLLRRARRMFPFIERIFADGGYAGRRMAMTVWRTGVWRLQIVKRSDAAGFEVLTFAWISRNRRLARDFERYTTTVTAFIRLAMIRIMLRRLAANASS